jgi:hypothetical protein
MSLQRTGVSEHGVSNTRREIKRGGQAVPKLITVVAGLRWTLLLLVACFVVILAAVLIIRASPDAAAVITYPQRVM